MSDEATRAILRDPEASPEECLAALARSGFRWKACEVRTTFKPGAARKLATAARHYANGHYYDPRLGALHMALVHYAAVELFELASRPYREQIQAAERWYGPLLPMLIADLHSEANTHEGTEPE